MWGQRVDILSSHGVFGAHLRVHLYPLYMYVSQYTPSVGRDLCRMNWPYQQDIKYMRIVMYGCASPGRYKDSSDRTFCPSCCVPARHGWLTRRGRQENTYMYIHTHPTCPSPTTKIIQFGACLATVNCLEGLIITSKKVISNEPNCTLKTGWNGHQKVSTLFTCALPFTLWAFWWQYVMWEKLVQLRLAVRGPRESGRGGG